MLLVSILTKPTLTLNLEDPATTEELGTIPEMGLPETQEAIDAAAAAFKTWGKTTAKVRAPASERLEYVTEWSMCTHRSATTSS